MIALQVEAAASCPIMTRTGTAIVASARRLAAAAIALRAHGACAQPAEPFFKGKVINLYIGFAAGGTYDYYARLVARFIGKHIPGNPTVVAQTMQGAGSLQLANFLFAQAPQGRHRHGHRHADGGARGGAAFAGRALQGGGVHLRSAA